MKYYHVNQDFDESYVIDEETYKRERATFYLNFPEEYAEHITYDDMFNAYEVERVSDNIFADIGGDGWFYVCEQYFDGSWIVNWSLVKEHYMDYLKESAVAING